MAKSARSTSASKLSPHESTKLPATPPKIQAEKLKLTDSSQKIIENKNSPIMTSQKPDDNNSPKFQDDTEIDPSLKTLVDLINKNMDQKFSEIENRISSIERKSTSFQYVAQSDKTEPPEKSQNVHSTLPKEQKLQDSRMLTSTSKIAFDTANITDRRHRTLSLAPKTNMQAATSFAKGSVDQ